VEWLLSDSVINECTPAVIRLVAIVKALSVIAMLYLNGWSIIQNDYNIQNATLTY